MAIDALVKPFLSLPLFRGLKPLQITEIVRRADRIVYRPGDVIIRDEQHGDAAIVIVSGEAVRVTGSEDNQLAESVPEGSMVGELAMLVETIHTTTVIAKTLVRALRLSRAEMHELMREDRALAEHLSLQIASRLKRLALELQSIDDVLAEVSNFDPPPLTPSSYRIRPALFH